MWRKDTSSGEFWIHFFIEVTEILQAEITQPASLQGCCRDIDVVISTIGITKQKDGLTYFDVDYQANLNLLNEAKKNRVQKFIYISVLNGENLRHLKICDAKELFVEQLIMSGLEYCIIRPNGFFSDMTEFYQMAKKGRVYLFGDGELRMNPIHGEDLAVVCVDAIDKPECITSIQLLLPTRLRRAGEQGVSLLNGVDMKEFFLMIVMVTFLGCASQEMLRVRQMDIQSVDISSIQDGEYIGSFFYSGFEYRVKTVVSAHKIIDIEILQNRVAKHAQLAEGVLKEIVKRQTPNVDAISGATTTSKALMKAVENSLIKKINVKGEQHP